jgi:hypothetical protein
VTLVAYADESGTHDLTGQHQGSEVAAVIGYVSWKDTWELFCSEWQKVLNDYGIAVFHMSECMDKINGPNDPGWPYRNWSDTKRDAFIRSLIHVALDHAWFGVGGLLNVRDYDLVSPDWLKTDAEHPYHFCFQLFFDALLPMLEKVSEPPLPPEEQVAFFFDQNRQCEDRASKAFHLIKALRDSKDRFGSITFATRKQHKPLQAADLIAYIIRQAQTRRIREGHQDSWLSGVIPGSWEELLISKRNVNIAYFDASNLKTVIAELEKDRLRLLAGSNGSGPVTAVTAPPSQ